MFWIKHNNCDTLMPLCAVQLADGAVENMRCPDPGCRKAVAAYVLRDVMTAVGLVVGRGRVGH